MHKRGPARACASLVATAVLAVLVSPSLATAAKPGSTTCPLPPTDMCSQYVLRADRWKQLPLSYYVNTSAAIAPLGFAQDVQDAFDAWEHELKSPAVEAAH